MSIQTPLTAPLCLPLSIPGSAEAHPGSKHLLSKCIYILDLVHSGASLQASDR